MDRLQGCVRNGMTLAVLCLTGICGCASVPDTQLAGDVLARSECCRDNVHIIFVESPFDIWHLARVPQVAAEFKRLGFHNTEMFDYHVDGDDDVLADRIREITVRHPDRRIMIIGFSSSCMIVEDAIGRVEEDGVWIDSAAYIDSFTYVRYRDEIRPQNVGRTLLIYRYGNQPPEGFPNEVEVHRVDETNHFCTPCNPYGFDVMLAEAIHLADGPCGCKCHPPGAEAIPQNDVPAVSLPEPAQLR